MASEVTSEMTRIHVGGLGERVTKDDVINTFSKLGRVESVDFIHTKGRSFAYINFYPSSQNALSKLFSTYNGCLWKGGKLKLEKAREHYMDRMKREWEEDAKASIIPQNDCVVDKDVVGPPKLNSSIDLDKAQIRMYFPKLRKVKSLPLRGTGKHKYSFQRVEVPPRPRHFCDCPEHSNPIDTREKISGNSIMKKRGFDRNPSSDFQSFEFPVEEQTQDSKIQDDGMNEEEISIMNSVMKKILYRETPKAEQVGRKDLLRENASAATFPVVANEADDSDDDDNDDDDDDDDDDIKINVSSKIKRMGRRELLQKNSSASRFLVDVNQVEDETDDDDNDDDSDIKINATSEKIECARRYDVNSRAFGSSTEAKGISDDDEDDDDDDIEINVMSGKNKGSNSQSWELKTSFDSEHQATLNEVPLDDDLRSQSDSQTQEKKDKVSIRKRKSLANENDEEKRTSPRSKKKARLPSNKSENHIENLYSVTEGGTKESSAHKGAVSQKSTWKELIKDGLTNPFSVSHVTPSNGTSSESEEHEGVENDMNENHDEKSTTQSSDKDRVFGAQPDKPITESEKSMKGSSWMQKGSWMQLVGGGNGTLFSISQTSGAKMEEQKTTKAVFGNPRGGFGPNNGASDAGRIGISNKTTVDKKSDSKEKTTLASRSYPEAESGDGCPFMRNADSVKEWTSAKTALSSALKRRNNKA